MELNRNDLLKKDYNQMIEKIREARKEIDKRETELQHRKITFRENEHIVRIDVQRNQHIGIMIKTKIFDLYKDKKEQVISDTESKQNDKTVFTYYLGDYH